MKPAARDSTPGWRSMGSTRSSRDLASGAGSRRSYQPADCWSWSTQGRDGLAVDPRRGRMGETAAARIAVADASAWGDQGLNDARLGEGARQNSPQELLASGHAVARRPSAWPGDGQMPGQKRNWRPASRQRVLRRAGRRNAAAMEQNEHGPQFGNCLPTGVRPNPRPGGITSLKRRPWLILEDGYAQGGSAASLNRR